MRIQDSVWQGCSGYWQPLFIREYWLPLGAAAWQGYLLQGRGLTICEVEPLAATVDWSQDPVAYRLTFMPQAQIADYLLGLQLGPEVIAALQQAVATYPPDQDLLLLLLSNGQLDLNHLQHMRVTPPECSRQLALRRGEFDLFADRA